MALLMMNWCKLDFLLVCCRRVSYWNENISVGLGVASIDRLIFVDTTAKTDLKPSNLHYFSKNEKLEPEWWKLIEIDTGLVNHDSLKNEQNNNSGLKIFFGGEILRLLGNSEFCSEGNCLYKLCYRSETWY